ncbi:MAG: flagellar filament capping protein FliD [Oscillospiraceae bacterium]
MAINGIYGSAQYFKYMSNAASVQSSLPAKTAASVNDFVFSQMSKANAGMQSLMNTRMSAYKNNLEKYAAFTKDSKSFNANFAANTSDLKASASALRDYARFGANANQIGSSNSAVLSIKSGSLNDGQKLNVSVQKLATQQTAKSSSFTSSLGYTLGGQSKIEITAKGKTSTLSFNMANATNNKDALTQMAGQINSAKLGVTATVETKNGKSTLSLASEETGAENAFTAKFTGNAEKLNMQTTQAAADAAYKVDGKDYTSAKNDITIGNQGVKATLTGVGSAEVQNGKTDNGKALETLKNFAQDYNKNVQFLKANSGKSNEIKNLAESFASTRYSAQSLGSIGITTKSDGQLSVDEKKFASALEKDPEGTRKVLEKLAQNSYDKTVQAANSANNLYKAPAMDSASGGGAYNAYKQFYTNPAAAANVLNMFL